MEEVVARNYLIDERPNAILNIVDGTNLERNLDEATRNHVESDIKAVEEEYDDDAESIITNERYLYIGKIIDGVYKNKQKGQLSTSDKIDKVVTNRWLGLPIFIIVMFLVYYISMVGVGKGATDWANAMSSWCPST